MKNNHCNDHLGIDASDLAEFPLALLANTPPAGSPLTMEFGDRDKKLMVSGHPKYGLPTALDMEVLIALLKHSQGRDLTTQIQFSRYALLRTMGWDTHSQGYERLTLALRRWSHTTLTATRTIHDPQTGNWLDEEVFKLLRAYRVRHQNENTGEEAEAATPSWFRWDPVMQELLQAGYYHTLDAAFYLSLKSPIAQAEYRYLAARARDGKPCFRQHLKTFAQQHIGLRQPSVSAIQRKLAPAHAELIARGFVTAVSYEVMQGREHGGEVMVLFRFPGTGAERRQGAERHPEQRAALPAEPAPAGEPAANPLVEQLVAAGLAPRVAARLATEWPEECARQLAYLPHRAALKSRAGALRRAIEEIWPAPESGPPASKPRRRAAPAAAPGAPDNEASAPCASLPPKGGWTSGATPAPAPDPAAEPATLDTWWNALSAAEQAVIDAAVQAELPAPATAGGQFLARRPAARARICRELRWQLRGLVGGEDRPRG
jgi:plasmid replication initiation protein